MIEQIALPSPAALDHLKAQEPSQQTVELISQGGKHVHILNDIYRQHQVAVQNLEAQITTAQACLDNLLAQGYEVIAFTLFTEGEGMNLLLHKRARGEA
jgi:hypothetical protein